MNPRVVRTVAELRAVVAEWRRGGSSVGMVPTMGALHAGHLSLASAARTACGRTVATLFVNPRQFAPNEDFAAYPRDEATDLRLLAEAGIDLLYAPELEEVYPPGFATTISVAGPAAVGLETTFRPHFFDGVATIVAKLLIAGLPDSAFFGEKDYQQLLVVRRLARDLALPVEIVGCPTVRDEDGLALSSRNAYLSADERARAPALGAAMRGAARAISDGAEPGDALAQAERQIAGAGFVLDYLEIRNSETLEPVADWRSEPLRMLAAAHIGRTRLIDNIAVSARA